MTCLANTQFRTANAAFGRCTTEIISPLRCAGADFGEIFILRDYFTQGGLWGWGCNSIGQLGNNTTINASSPIQTISGGTNWKNIAAGILHTAAIKTDATLWLWGSNTNGQLGINNALNRSSPVQTISGGTDWKRVSVGFGSTAAVKTNGTLWNWGYGGDGTLGDNATISRSSPVQTIAGGCNWRCAVAGRFNGAGIKTDGTLWVWGRGCDGILGNNSTIPVSSPVQTIGSATTWKHVSIAAGNFMAGIKTDGTLWTWGKNEGGLLGNNTTINASSPVQLISGGTNWKQICAGYYNGAAIKIDGTLWVWGCGTFGSTGANSTLNRSSPVQTIAGGTNWKNVAVGRLSVLATKTNGTLWNWGCGTSGTLGDNTTVNKSSPVQTIAGGCNWRSVSSGGYTAWGIKQY
jgi:alpha-tubulin suppressor-like RCC1 family protein